MDRREIRESVTTLWSIILGLHVGILEPADAVYYHCRLVQGNGAPVAFPTGLHVPSAMTKKKLQRLQDSIIEPTIKASQPPESSTQFVLPSTTSHNPSTHKASKIADSPPTSALIICRNKYSALAQVSL